MDNNNANRPMGNILNLEFGTPPVCPRSNEQIEDQINTDLFSCWMS